MKFFYGKSQSVKLFLGSLIFVIAGYFMITNPSDNGRYSAFHIQIIGFVAVAFFGLGIYASIRMFFEKSPALAFDWEGIKYDVKKGKHSFISWNEIESFSEIKIHGQKMILVHLKYPQKFIDNEPNVVKRKLMEFNFANYNAPISISASTLKVSIDQLRAGIEMFSQDTSHNRR